MISLGNISQTQKAPTVKLWGTPGLKRQPTCSQAHIHVDAMPRITSYQPSRNCSEPPGKGGLALTSKHTSKCYSQETIGHVHGKDVEAHLEMGEAAYSEVHREAVQGRLESQRCSRREAGRPFGLVGFYFQDSWCVVLLTGKAWLLRRM